MKKLILLLTMTLMALPMGAKSYRGMFDIGAGPGFGHGRIHTSYGDFEQNNSTFGGLISTAHGCQFTPNLFAGAGFGVAYEDTKALNKGAIYAEGNPHTANHLLSIPIFADLRWDLHVDRNITPFADLRLGYQISTDGLVMYRAASTTDSEVHRKGLMKSKDSMYIQVAAGARFKVANNLGINVGLSYIPILKRNVAIETTQAINRSLLLLNVGIDFQGAAKSTMKEKRKDRLYRLQQEQLKKQKKKFDIK